MDQVSLRIKSEEMTIEVGVLIAIASALIGYILFTESLEEIKSDGRQGAKQTRNWYISKGVDDIRIDLKANEKQMIVLGERITRVEEC